MKTQKTKPSHIYILLGIGLALRLIFYFSVAHTPATVVQAVSIALDIAIGYVIYRLVILSPHTDESSTLGWQPLFLTSLWVLNPAPIFASSIGGFAEPIFVLLIVVVLIALRDKFYSTALILLLPAIFQLRVWMGVNDASNSAANIFAIFNGLGGHYSSVFLGLSFAVWGAIFTLIIALVAAAALYFDFQTGGKHYYLLVGAYFTLMFVFTPNVNERGLFIGLLFLLIHYIERRDPRIRGLYLAFSATFFMNAYAVRQGPPSFYVGFMQDSMYFASAANVLFALVLLYVLITTLLPKLKWFAPPHKGELGGAPYKRQQYIWVVMTIGVLVRGLMVSTRVDGEAPWFVAQALIIVFCDLAIGYMLFYHGVKTQKTTSRGWLPIILGALWILNPGAIIASSVFGLMETALVLALILALLLIRGKMPPLLYALYMPIPALWIYMTRAPYGVRSAYNFFALIGSSFWPLSTRFMGFTYGFIGAVVIFCLVIGTAIAFIEDYKQGASNCFLIFAGFFVLMFVFSNGMQMRHLFPALPLLLLHAVEKRDKRVLMLFILFSATFFINAFAIYRGGYYPYEWGIWAMVDRRASLIPASLGNALLGSILFIVIINTIWPKAKWLSSEISNERP